MQVQHSAGLEQIHATLWERFQPLLEKQRFPQSILLTGPRHIGIKLFIQHLLGHLLCKEGKYCGHCSECTLLLKGTHADVYIIKPEDEDSVIKIEPIRSLQQDVYQTPQRGRYRLIVIESADKMNTAAANALLKVLEEPPKHTLFILIAEHINNLLPTILSRCQKFVFPEIFQFSEVRNYLRLTEFYPEDSVRAELGRQKEVILSTLCDLIEKKISPCTVAAQWAVYPLRDLLWFLHLLTAQTIYRQLNQGSNGQKETSKFEHFCSLLEPYYQFMQLDAINAVLRKINHNININPILTLEQLLLGYLRVIDG